MLKIVVGCLVVISMFAGSQAEQATRITIERYQPDIIKNDSVIAPAKSEFDTLWLGESKARSYTSGSYQYLIVDGKGGDLLSIYPKFETYQLYDRQGNWMNKDLPTQVERDLQKGMAAISPDIRLTIHATEELDTIRGVQCRRFEFFDEDKFGTKVSDVWISERHESQIDLFHKIYYGLTLFVDGHEFVEEELKQIRGLPMLGVLRGNVRRTEAIIAIDTVAVDSNFFEIPAGYEEYK